MFSGGVGSWAAAKRVAHETGTDNLILCFADTLIEDEDLYRFIEEAANDVGGKLVRLSEGRTPWEVFFDGRFLGNSRIDPCSRILKRQLIRKWLEENFDPQNTVVYIGIDWTEEHRYKRALKYWDPWVCKAPLCDPPFVNKKEIHKQLEKAGIRLPRLYEMGFPHNNCGGFCIKAGHAHFKLLLEKMPDRFAEHEENEQKFREFIGKDVSILKDRRGGKFRTMTLKELRDRVEKEKCEGVDMNEWGGCGCFSP